MASAESSASLHAAAEAAAPAAPNPKTKKPRKQSVPVQKAPGTGKRVTAPKTKLKAKGANWLERAQTKALAAREVKESGAYAALKNKKPHLIRGVSVSPFGENKFVVWIAGRGADDTFENKDGLALSESICKEHKSLLENLASLDPTAPGYPQNTIQMLDSKLYPAKEDPTVAWKSVTKVKFQAVQVQAEDEDEEMPEAEEE